MESDVSVSAIQELTRSDNGSMMRASLVALPPEILILVFAQLSSLPDALALAAASKRLLYVLQGEGDPIARTLAQSSLLCPQEAWQLLADQDEPLAKGYCARIRALQHMLRNQQAVDRAILRFENVVVRHVKCHGFDTLKEYGQQPRPRHLTSTERLRFTRAFYQLRSLACLGEEQWAFRLAQFSNLRHLYYLQELCLLPLSINAATPPNERQWQAPLWSDPARQPLHSAVWDRIHEIHCEAWGQEADTLDLYAMEDGYMGYVVLWDHWQEDLQQIICRWKPTELGKQATLDRTHLWISDEE